MSDSLHELSTARTFAAWGHGLWKKWNTIGTTATRVQERKKILKHAMRAILRNINVHPGEVSFAALGDEGSMSRSDWEVVVNSAGFDNNNIKLAKFIEIMKTAYHEIRHLEQYYRMAQALSLGIADWPGDVKKKITTLKNATAAQISTQLGVNQAAVINAISNRTLYDRFAYTEKMSHCVIGRIPNRPNDKWSLTVENWIYRRYKPDMKAWGERGLNAPVGGVIDKQFYWRGELDKDTTELEKLLEGRMQNYWPNYNSVKDKGRQDPAF